MALFDSIVSEARAKYDLGDKAEVLLAELLKTMNSAAGGFSGFLQRFNNVGLGNTAASWINSGANTSLSYEQLESAFGEETLDGIARDAGLDYKTTVFASSFMIPHIVDELSPTGVAPDQQYLKRQVNDYMMRASSTNAAVTFDRIDAAASVEDLDTIDGENENTVLNWLMPLIILGFLIAIGFAFCGKA